jgi:microcystin-dependent protein
MPGEMPMRAIRCVAIAILAFPALLPGALSADITGSSGGGQPQTTIQPSLGLNYIIRTDGTFDTLGDISLFAGGYAPGGWAFAAGQNLPIAQNDALFSLLGTTYGGDGQHTFALPDLRGRVAIGTGNGPGLTPRSLGQHAGVEQVTLTTDHLPQHAHSLPPSSSFTGLAGQGQSYTNMQPSLGLSYRIATQGIYPPRESGGTEMPFVGQVTLSAAARVPTGFAPANGQVTPISQNTALFSILGVNYGGDGRSTFALPDLRGRAAVEAGSGRGLTPQLVGEETGVESVTLLQSQLPPHSHTLPPGAGHTGITGGGLPQTNMQPTLALHYIVATEGVYPVRDGGAIDPTLPFLGQITLFAGTYAPGGWAFADGQLMPIQQNAALFSILGPTYGGDGRTTFALPDLQDRIPVGFGQGPGLSNWSLGQVSGLESLVLTEAQMPAHVHTYTPVPEPSAFCIFAGAMLLFRRRRP